MIAPRVRRPLYGLLAVGLLLFVLLVNLPRSSLPPGLQGPRQQADRLARLNPFAKQRLPYDPLVPHPPPKPAPEKPTPPSLDFADTICRPDELREGPFLRDVNNPGRIISAPGRLADVSNAFEYYRQSDECTISSLELHDPFEPLCQDKESVLAAMTGGGRGGKDMPFIPRGCDMRWFTTLEICGILSKYSHIWIIGDSLMRHVTSAIHLFLRQDLIDGARMSWKPDPSDYPCDCDKPFNSGGCLFNEAWSTADIMKFEPDSIRCMEPEIAAVEYDVQPEYPLLDMVPSLSTRLPKEKPPKPQAFIFGHGLWNDLNETITTYWLDQIETAVNLTNPWLTEPGAVHPRLFMTPSASGPGKPELYVATQGNPALRRFEMDVADIVHGRGMDHMGTVNMTLQSTSPDGTHAGMRQDMVKAQMILNWLNMYDISGY